MTAASPARGGQGRGALPYRLFFALFPQAVSHAAIDATEHALSPSFAGVRWIAEARRHMTVLFLGQYAQPPHHDIALAHAAMEGHTWSPCRVVMDRMLALGHPRRPALALAASAVPPLLAEQQQALAARLRATGLRGEGAHAFLPHLTLAYVGAQPALPAIAPIELAFDELWLLLSQSGQQDYQRLGHWPTTR